MKHMISPFNTISPTTDTWIGTSAGKRGFQYAYWVTKDSLRAELRIDLGKDANEENLRLFNQLKSNQAEIESLFGGPLEWNEAEGYRVCIIRKQLSSGGYRNHEEEWNVIVKEGINTMDRLEKSLKPFLIRLK